LLRRLAESRDLLAETRELALVLDVLLLVARELLLGLFELLLELLLAGPERLSIVAKRHASPLRTSVNVSPANRERRPCEHAGERTRSARREAHDAIDEPRCDRADPMQELAVGVDEERERVPLEALQRGAHDL